MSVDRIARAMTAGGPSPAFKAKVMAPIHGRPRADFTQRVMNEAGVAQRSRVAQPFRARVVLAAAAIALAIGAVALTRSRETAPLAPPAAPIVQAPVMSPAPGVEQAPPKLAQQVTPAQGVRPRRVTAAARPASAGPSHAPIYTIAALEAMPDIEMKSIEPASCTIPALEGPAPLRVTDLPGTPGGSRNQNFKERP